MTASRANDPSTERKPEVTALQPSRTATAVQQRTRPSPPGPKHQPPPHALFERDSYSATAFAEVLDRSSHAAVAKATMGLSPASIMTTYFDWLIHLSAAPGKQLQLTEKAMRKWTRLQRHVIQQLASGGSAECCIEPLPQDKRFQGDEWRQWPFNVYYQSHLLMQQWWHVATTGVPGVSTRHERVLEFGARQILDVFAPSNFLLTNPELLARTARENGRNLTRGFQNLVEDWERSRGGRPPAGAEEFVPGRDVAVTPGHVVYRNHLIELIQYEPTTPKVGTEPILIVPAWIMKYYILDLSPEKSMIKYLVDSGFTVFCISWRNPGPDDRSLGMDEYRSLGIMAALDAISTIVPDTKVHGIGYCLGGTLLAIAAAALSRNDHMPFHTLSFLAAQIDFQEPGELQLFIDESQLRFLEDMMWEQGFLDTKQMSGAFQLLRSNDLIWSKMMREYLMGERAPMNDLMAWNADTTRLPYRMHSEYLRHLYLNNDLAEGRLIVDGLPVSASDIRVPVFCVGTQTDHVAPWRSVFKWHLLTDTETTFLLTSGGHNSGIVSEPGHPRRSYQISTQQEADRYKDPDTWVREVPVEEGSWWPAWASWLRQRTTGERVPPQMGAEEKGFRPLTEAPGTYVNQR
jgi:polyhydroxyalkanoate synthase subunit PhaC